MRGDDRRVCVVTGRGGYVGGVIADTLAARGFAVHGLSRSAGYALGEPVPAGALPRGGIDTLVHCAYDFSVSSWAAVRRVNVEGSLRLFEAADRAGVQRIIFISSLAAYDGCRSLYGRGKIEVERAVLARGWHVVRPGTVFGSRSAGIMGRLAALVMARRWIPVLRHPGPLHLTHDEDLAALISYLAETRRPAARAPWLAAGPRGWRLEELVQEMARRAGRSVRTVPVPWQLAWAGLRALEAAGLRPAFRSDNVLSLGHPIPPEQLSHLERAGWPMRDY
jgi:nucleoside-diphosphate-sugar epimerase